jgi:hypothetical protein
MAGIVLISNPSGSGSGFVVDLDGHIVTNYHVVRKEKYHTVTFFVREKGAIERRKIEDVELEALCPLYDLALLRVDLERRKRPASKCILWRFRPATRLVLAIRCWGEIRAWDRRFSRTNRERRNCFGLRAQF